MWRLSDNAEDNDGHKHEPDNWKRIAVFQDGADKRRGHDGDHGDTEKCG